MPGSRAPTTTRPTKGPRGSSRRGRASRTPRRSPHSSGSRPSSGAYHATSCGSAGKGPSRSPSRPEHHSFRGSLEVDPAGDGPKKSRSRRCLVMSAHLGTVSWAKLPVPGVLPHRRGAAPILSGRRLGVSGPATEIRGATLSERSPSKRSRKEDEAFPIRPAMVRPEGFHGSHHLEARSPPSPHLTMWRAVGPTIAVKRTVATVSTE